MNLSPKGVIGHNFVAFGATGIVGLSAKIHWALPALEVGALAFAYYIRREGTKDHKMSFDWDRLKMMNHATEAFVLPGIAFALFVVSWIDL